jgi:hypothetical protein
MRMGISNDAMKWVGILSRTAESKMSQPPLDSKAAHEPARYLSTLSINGWNADGGSLVGERGRW